MKKIALILSLFIAMVVTVKAQLPEESVYIIKSAWSGSYTNTNYKPGAIAYNGTSWSVPAEVNKYERIYWMVFDGWTRGENLPLVDSYDTNGKHYVLKHFDGATPAPDTNLLAGFDPAKGVQIVKTSVDGVYNLQYSTPKSDHRESLHADEIKRLVAWEPATNRNSASAWEIEYIGQRETIESMLQAMEALQEQYNIVMSSDKVVGESVGEYNDAAGTYYGFVEDAREVLNNSMADVMENYTADRINAVREALAAGFSSLQLNMPQAGKYYRIKGANDNAQNYITCNTITINNQDSRTALTANADASTIFYYNGESLKAIQNGKYLSLESSWTPAESADNVSFYVSPRKNEAYLVKSGDRYLHYSDTYLNRCQNDSEHSAHDWFMEEVAENDAYATLIGAGYFATGGNTTYVVEASITGGNVGAKNGLIDIPVLAGGDNNQKQHNFTTEPLRVLAGAKFNITLKYALNWGNLSLVQVYPALAEDDNTNRYGPYFGEWTENPNVYAVLTNIDEDDRVTVDMLEYKASYPITIPETASIGDVYAFRAQTIATSGSDLHGGYINFVFVVDNLPTGKYYTIKSGVDNKYLAAPANGATGVSMILSDASDANSIMYFDNANLLVYGTGQYVNGKNHAHYGYKGTYQFKAHTSGDAYVIDQWYNNNGTLANDGNGEQENTRWIVEPVTSLPVKISAAKYSTFYAPVALQVPDDVTAFYIDGSSKQEGYINLIEIEDRRIPANTGVVLAGEAGTYNLDFIEDVVDPIEDNLLDGTVAATLFEGATNDAYILAMPNIDGVQHPVGLYKTKCEFNATGGAGTSHYKNNGHKAYLPISALPSGLSTTVGFRFGGEEIEGATAIEEVEAVPASDVVYDLQGRRVEKITKAGIYIVNGKAVLVK